MIESKSLLVLHCPFQALLGPCVPFLILLVFHGTIPGTAGTAFYIPETALIA
jgi:hypothetical protein